MGRKFELDQCIGNGDEINDFEFQKDENKIIFCRN